MTDDVTRGLGLLADEARAPDIDTDAIIASATALSRNRAILTTALVTLIVLCALVVMIGAVKAAPPIADRPKATHGPVIGTELTRLATQEEQDRRKKSLHDMITKAFDHILPKDWKPSTFDFECDQYHCWAEGEIRDDGGAVGMRVNIGADYEMGSCYQPDCTRELLDDGTLVTVTKQARGEPETPGGGPTTWLGVSAVRPDGTTLNMWANWPLSRTAPVLTDDQWREFATAFTY